VTIYCSFQLEHQKVDIQFAKRESVQLERTQPVIREAPEVAEKAPEEKEKYKRAEKPGEDETDEGRKLALQKAKVRITIEQQTCNSVSRNHSCICDWF